MFILIIRYFLFCCSLFCLPGCVSTDTIVATVGSDVTLTCSYDAKYYGRLSVCWGRGEIPNSGCGNEVIKSDGTSVISRLSERYLLSGDLGGGDVSLTIRQVEMSDSGTYGCRVEIPGWFNDQKHHLTLTVVAAIPDPLALEVKEVTERTVTLHWSLVFDGGSPITSYWILYKNKQTSWDTAVKTVISNPGLTQVTLMDLRPANTYNFRMHAVNIVGVSNGSNVHTVTMNEAAPEGPPLDMQLEALSPHSIKVTWKPPRAHLRNGVLRSYIVNYREYEATIRQFKVWQYLSVTAGRELESVVLRNLKPSTLYGVLVQARTEAGIGPASTAPLCSTLDEVPTTTAASTIVSSFTSAVIRGKTTTNSISAPATSTATTTTSTIVWLQSTSFKSVPPKPPVLRLKEVTENTISLSWTPGFMNDSPITGYFLEYKAVNESWDYTKRVVDFSPIEREATIIEINPSTYNIRLFARNNLSVSKPSNVLTITTGKTDHKFKPVIADTTPVPNDTHPEADERPPGHLVAIVVPVVLVLLVVAAVITWQLRRMKNKQGSLNMWLTSGALRYKASESLQEL